MKTEHEQVEILLMVGPRKRRARSPVLIDAGIANQVLKISSIRGIVTHSSCQGTDEIPAYVFVSWESADARKRLAQKFPTIVPIARSWGAVMLDFPGSFKLQKEMYEQFAEDFRNVG